MNGDSSWFTGLVTGIILALCFTRPRVLNFFLNIFVKPAKKIGLV